MVVEATYESTYGMAPFQSAKLHVEYSADDAH